jgi:glycosyltransferase involved in cell wall biosynthesis
MAERPPLVMVGGKDIRYSAGGHGAYVRAHAYAAQAAGFEPHVFCVSDRSARELSDFGCLHRVASPMRTSYRAALVHRPALARAVARYLEELDHPGPHMVHSFGPWAECGVSAARALRRRGIVAVPIASAYSTLEHEQRAMVGALARHHGLAAQVRYRLTEIWIRAVASHAERRGYAASRVVLVNYESVCELLRDACTPELALRIVPYAAPAAFQRPEKPAPQSHSADSVSQAPLIVCVARQDPRKGLDVLLSALAGLNQRGVAFRASLVGRGPLLEAHRRRAAALGLAELVSIPGHVKDVFDYLDRADIFVLPSLAEGSGSVAILEALQAGLAVVTTRCDGLPEDLTDGDNALLVQPGDVASLEHALARLLTDATLRSTLAAAARSTYEQQFSAANFTAALSAVYAEFGAAQSHSLG